MNNIKKSQIAIAVAAVLLIIACFMASRVLTASAFGVSKSETKSVMDDAAFVGVFNILLSIVAAAAAFFPNPAITDKIKTIAYGALAGFALLGFIILLCQETGEVNLGLAKAEVSHGFGCWLELIGAAVAGCATYLHIKQQ